MVQSLSGRGDLQGRGERADHRRDTRLHARGDSVASEVNAATCVDESSGSHMQVKKEAWDWWGTVPAGRSPDSRPEITVACEGNIGYENRVASWHGRGRPHPRSPYQGTGQALRRGLLRTTDVGLAWAHYGVSRASNRSSQPGLVDSIRSTFRLRSHPLICFSLSMADRGSVVSSK